MLPTRPQEVSYFKNTRTWPDLLSVNFSQGPGLKVKKLAHFPQRICSSSPFASAFQASPAREGVHPTNRLETTYSLRNNETRRAPRKVLPYFVTVHLFDQVD